MRTFTTNSQVRLKKKKGSRGVMMITRVSGELKTKKIKSMQQAGSGDA